MKIQPVTPAPLATSSPLTNSTLPAIDRRTPQEQVCALLGVPHLQSLGDLRNKKVFLRVDANVSSGCPDFAFHPRIRQVAQTLSTLLQAGARVLVTSHHSTADGASLEEKSKQGVFDAFVRNFPKLGASMQFLPFQSREILASGIHEQHYVKRALERLERTKPGEAIVLENIRLLPLERRGRADDLPRQIAESFDVVVNDAFGVGHRYGQFSVDGISQYVPFERKAIGPAALEEWTAVYNFVSDAPKGSIGVVLGGDAEKFGTKLLLLHELLKSDRVGLVYLGGVFATTYLHAQGSQLATTPVSGDPVHHKILAELPTAYPHVRFELPNELRGLDSLSNLQQWKLGTRNGHPHLELPRGSMALDQSPHDLTQAFARTNISRVLAVGPLGYYIRRAFALGTVETYRTLAHWAIAREDRRLLVGGGNSLESLLTLNEYREPGAPNVTLSSGGGALLNAVAGVLNTPTAIQTPAIKALRRR
jgi:phosphoglycerate kinase